MNTPQSNPSPSPDSSVIASLILEAYDIEDWHDSFQYDARVKLKQKLEALMVQARIDELERTWVHAGKGEVQTLSDEKNFTGKPLLISKSQRLKALRTPAEDTNRKGEENGKGE